MGTDAGTSLPLSPPVYRRDRQNKPPHGTGGQRMTCESRLSLDEITAIVTDFARHETVGADCFQALRMLSQQQATAVMLPVPLTNDRP